MFIPFIFMFAHITLTVSQYYDYYPQYDYRPHVVDMQHDSFSEYEGQEKRPSAAAPLEGTQLICDLFPFFLFVSGNHLKIPSQL